MKRKSRKANHRKMQSKFIINSKPKTKTKSFSDFIVKHILLPIFPISYSKLNYKCFIRVPRFFTIGGHRWTLRFN